MGTHKIELLKGTSQLHGTYYIEFSLGKHQVGDEHWRETSAYLNADNFDPLIKLFRKHVPNFDFIGFIIIPAVQWQKIILNLTRLQHELKTISNYQALQKVLHLGEYHPEIFQKPFDKFIKEFGIMIDDLRSWLELQLETHDFITFLGL